MSTATGKGLRFPLGQVILFLVLAIVFSVLPFALALVLDKSSLLFAIFTTWYALVPPVVLFLLALWLNRREPHWLRAWVACGYSFRFGLSRSTCSRRWQVYT